MEGFDFAMGAVLCFLDFDFHGTIQCRRSEIEVITKSENLSVYLEVEWWLRPESNRHFPEGNTILNRARLPIPPLSLQIET